MDLTVEPHSRYTWWWVHLQLRGVDRGIDVVLLADQIDEDTWRAMQAELRRPRPDAPDDPSGSGRNGDGSMDLR